VIPKGIGFASYFLMLSAIALLIITLIASENIDLLHLSTANELPFQTQIGLSLLNSTLTILSAIAILKGSSLGRAIWHLWSIGYLLINIWQLHQSVYLVPQVATLLLMTFILYAKPAKLFFDTHKQARRGKRITQSTNIFE
jgi:hypothetical protein